MDTSAKAMAALALNRFGLGPRLGSIAAIASDPRGALLAELDRPRAGEIDCALFANQRASLPGRRRCERRATGPTDHHDASAGGEAGGGASDERGRGTRQQ